MLSQKFSQLGFGLGFRPCHYQQILTSPPKTLDWLEVISENFMNIGGKPRTILEQAKTLYPIALHGVGMSIGSPDPINKTYLNHLKELVSWLNPILISDHLCFTKYRNHNSHDLLPVPYSKAMLERIGSRVDEVQQLLGRRFMLENPSAYVAFADNDFSEAEFLAELITKTGCGLLLDVNNVFVNHMNLGLDPIAYLKQIPADSVGQIHLAGHSIETNALGTVRIDTHDHPINAEVWELYRLAIKKWPDASPMIEWDDHIPALDDLLNMVEHAKSLTPKDFTNSTNSDINSIHLTQTQQDCALENLFSMATDSRGLEANDPRLKILTDKNPVPRLLGSMVYNNAYFARLRDVLKDEFPTLAGVTNDDGFDAIAASYLAAFPPIEADVGLLGKHLSQHLDQCTIGHIDFGVDMAALCDIAKLDRLRAETFTHPSNVSSITKTVLAEVQADQWETLTLNFNPTFSPLTTRYEIAPVWAAINSEESPSLPKKSPQHIAVWRWEDHVYHEVIADAEWQLVNHLKDGGTFAEAVHALTIDGDAATPSKLEEKSNFAIHKLVRWFDQGYISGINV